MSLFGKEKIAREEKIKQLEKANSNTKEKLIREQIRGELIKWSNQLSYMSRLNDIIASNPYNNTSNTDFYYINAANEFIETVNFNFCNYCNVYPEFISGINIMSEKVNKMLANMDIYYLISPVDSLVSLAKANKLNPIVNYVDELATAVISMKE